MLFRVSSKAPTTTTAPPQDPRHFLSVAKLSVFGEGKVAFLSLLRRVRVRIDATGEHDDDGDCANGRLLAAVPSALRVCYGSPFINYHLPSSREHQGEDEHRICTYKC